MRRKSWEGSKKRHKPQYLPTFLKAFALKFRQPPLHFGCLIRQGVSSNLALRTDAPVLLQADLSPAGAELLLSSAPQLEPCRGLPELTEAILAAEEMLQQVFL